MTRNYSEGESVLLQLQSSAGSRYLSWKYEYWSESAISVHILKVCWLTSTPKMPKRWFLSHYAYPCSCSYLQMNIDHLKRREMSHTSYSYKEMKRSVANMHWYHAPFKPLCEKSFLTHRKHPGWPLTQISALTLTSVYILTFLVKMIKKYVWAKLDG